MDLYLNLAEPHEICGEDNYGNMIWKRTPAGDFAAVPCPPDATGKLRQKTDFILAQLSTTCHLQRII